MSKLRWQLLLGALALAAIPILLLTQQPLLRAFTAEPAQGGVFIEGLVGSIGRLNPLLDSANPADQDINRLIFSGLVRFDGRGNPPGRRRRGGAGTAAGSGRRVARLPRVRARDGEPLTS